jgi:hypothetical protein
MAVKGILCYASTVANLTILLENVSATQIDNQTQISGAMGNSNGDDKMKALVGGPTLYQGHPEVIL